MSEWINFEVDEWGKRVPAGEALAESGDLEARVRALADEWEARAIGSAQSAAAREGLSDAHQLTDYSEMMHRRARDLRALLGVG